MDEVKARTDKEKSLQNRFRYRRLWLTLGWLLIASIIWFSLTSRPPTVLHVVKFADKFWHFLSYAFAMTWFAQLYVNFRHRLFILAGLVLLGVGLEYLQSWGGVRHFDVFDMLANTLGAVAAYLFCWRRRTNLLLKIEQKLAEPDQVNK